MTEGKLLPKILTFALPVLLSNVLQCLYNAADIIVVGRFASDLALAAVGATTSVINLVINLFIAISAGVSVTVATAVGARNHERAQKLVHSAILLAIVFGSAVTVGSIFLTRPLLEMMDTPTDIIDMSADYMRIFLGGAVFNLVYNFGAAILRASGDSRRPLYYLTIAGITNVFLNFFFVIVCDMTAAGVALATTIAQAISAILVVIRLLRHEGDCRLSFKKLRFFGSETKDILRMGLPGSVQSLVFSLSNTMIQASVNSFHNSQLVAGNSAALNVESFVYNGMNAMYTTAVTAVGQNVGAGKYDRIGKVMRYCVATVICIGLVLGGASYLFAEPLLGVYLPKSPDAVQYGVIRLSIIGFTYFVCGIMDTLVGCQRGMGTTLVPMIASVSGVCGIRIVWIMTVFAYFRTLESLYLSYPATWIFTAILQFVLYTVVKRRMVRRATSYSTEKERIPA
ncbi:MAG: MATE family efflux transporter [Clostridia bacterium]|nr:MATE family efflux transporter [Clostridia bacterium]